MRLYIKGQKLSEIIFDNPAAIPVFNRLGLHLGVGNKTLESYCLSAGLNTDFVETILNVSLNDDFFPEEALKSLNQDMLNNYLLETDKYYTHVQLPNIARHLDSLIRQSNDKGNLELLRKFFDDLRDELSIRANKELSENRCLDDDWQIVSDRNSDLLSFFVIHLKGNYNHNLCNAVVNAIFTLDLDLRQTTRIRRSILLPFLKNHDR